MQARGDACMFAILQDQRHRTYVTLKEFPLNVAIHVAMSSY